MSSQKVVKISRKAYLDGMSLCVYIHKQRKRERIRFVLMG